jgi:hypothetical protein
MLLSSSSFSSKERRRIEPDCSVPPELVAARGGWNLRL